jgi:hypothetical protein
VEPAYANFHPPTFYLLILEAIILRLFSHCPRIRVNC